MADELQLYHSNEDVMSLIPESKKYDQNYRVNRVKLSPIDITETAAKAIFQQILDGAHAIVLGNHLVMCSSIMSIDPLPIIKKPSKGHFDGEVWVEEK